MSIRGRPRVYTVTDATFVSNPDATDGRCVGSAHRRTLSSRPGSVANDADDPGRDTPTPPTPPIPSDTPQELSMPTFPAINHVALTVRDLDRSVPWYTRLLDAAPVLDEDTGPFRHVVWNLDGTLLGLHQFPEGSDAQPFDERRPGLDHVAFGCVDRDELLTWRARLDALDVVHGGIVDAPYGSGLSFRDPDGLPLELFAPAS